MELTMETQSIRQKEHNLTWLGNINNKSKMWYYDERA